MTRETKVGLVVAGSFLVLLGVVIASKMRGGDEPGPEVAQTVSPGDEQSETKEKKEPPKPGAKVVTPPNLLSEDIKPVGALEPSPKPFELPALPGLIGVPPEPFPPRPEFPGPDEEQKKKLALLERAKEFPPPGTLPAPPPPGAFVPLPPPGGERLALADPPPVPPLPGFTPPPPAPPVKVDGLPLPVPPPPGFDLPGPKKLESPPPPAVFPGATLPPPGLPAPKPDTLPPPVPFPPLESVPFEKKTPPGPPPVGLAPPGVGKIDPAPLGSDFKPVKPPVGIAPPPPTPTPMGTLPRVVSVDPSPYVIRPEDKDFASISQKIFGTDRYAQALLAFNREHPLTKEEIRTTPPRLVNGQMLYVPPKDFLESKYARLIPEARPIIGASGPDVPAVKITVPGFPMDTPKVTPGVPVSLGSTKGGAATPPRGDLKRFVVPGPGKHIMEIAQQTLGDGKLWSEIYRLNPTIRPEAIIPGGTELLIPEVRR